MFWNLNWGCWEKWAVFESQLVSVPKETLTVITEPYDQLLSNFLGYLKFEKSLITDFSKRLVFKKIEFAIQIPECHQMKKVEMTTKTKVR